LTLNSKRITEYISLLISWLRYKFLVSAWSLALLFLGKKTTLKKYCCQYQREVVQLIHTEKSLIGLTKECCHWTQ